MAIQKKDIITEEAIRAPLELAENTDKAVKSLENIIRTGKEGDKSLNLAKNTREVTKEVKNLTTAEKELNKQNKEIQRLQSRLTPEYKRQQGTVQRLRAEQLKMNKALREQAQRAAGVQGGFKRLGGVLKSTLLRFTAMVAGVSALIRLFRSGFNIIKNYASANSTLNGILRRTRKETEALRKQQKQLGATTVFSATQVAKAQTELAKLGLTMEQIQAITPSILDAAVAMGVDLADAAELVAGQLNAFGLSADQGGRVADVLTRSTQISAFNFERLKTALGVVSPAANAVNASLEDTVGILSAAVDANIDASTAATSLRNIFIELGKQGISWNEAMERINSSTDKLNAANELFGKRGAVVATVIAENTDKINANTKALEEANGAAREFAEEQLDNLEGDLRLLSSAWEGFILSIEQGDGVIAKVFRNLIQFITSVLEGLNRLSVEFGGEDFFGDAATRLVKFTQKLKDLKSLQEALIKTFQEGSISLEQFIKDNEQLEALIDKTQKTIDELNKELNPTIDLMPVLTNEVKAQTNAWKDHKSAVDEDVEALKRLRRINTALRDELSDTQKLLIRLVEESFGGRTIEEAGEESLNAIEENLKKTGELLKEENRKRKQEAEEAKRIEKEKQEALADLQQEGFNSAFNIIANLGEARNIQFDLDLQRLEKSQEEELSQIEDANRKKGESEENFRMRQESIEEKRQAVREDFARRREQLELEQARRNRRQAIFEKVLAAAQIGINTAQAISKTIAASPLTGGLPFSAIVGAIGAAQLAAVLTQPIPAFAEGTDNAPRGLAVINELGPELITDKSGKSRIVGTDGPTLTYLKGGEVITPADETASLMASKAAGNMLVEKRRARSNREIIVSLDRNFNRLTKTIKNKREPIVILKQSDRSDVWDDLMKTEYR